MMNTGSNAKLPRWSMARIGILGLCALVLADRPQRRPVYVTNADSLDISTFLVDVVTGKPDLVGGRVRAGGGVRNMAMTPDARHAYAGNSDNSTISAYSVGPQGVLSPLPGAAATVPSGGVDPVGGVVAPDGRTLYFAHVFEENPTGGSISVFTIASNGAITPLGSPVITPEPHPRGLVITPDGRFLYAGHGDPGVGRNTSVGAVTSYAIRSDGTLSPIGSPIHAGRFCGDSTITPDGRRLYVLCQDFNQIFGFAIGSSGGLSPLPRSPYVVTGEFPEGIASSPDGHAIFVASPGRITNGSVSAFTTAADGSLTEVSGSPYPAGIGPVGIATLPNGRFVYASTDADASAADPGALAGFAISPSGGLRALPGSPFRDGGMGPAYGSFSVLPNQGPVARFAAHVGGKDNLVVQFDASASSDPDGNVARYAWDFGDGAVTETAEPRTEHVYARAGSFQATLTVTDDEGCSTALVSIGRTVLCAGTAAAAASGVVVVGR